MVSKLGLQMRNEHIRINPKNNLPVRYDILTALCYYVTINNPFICGLEGWNLIAGRNLAGAQSLLKDFVVLPADFIICQLGPCHSLQIHLSVVLPSQTLTLSQNKLKT